MMIVAKAFPKSRVHGFDFHEQRQGGTANHYFGCFWFMRELACCSSSFSKRLVSFVKAEFLDAFKFSLKRTRILESLPPNNLGRPQRARGQAPGQPDLTVG